MKLLALSRSILNAIVGFLASTKIGQFSIKQIDTIFWSVEQVGKYTILENSKAENNKFMRFYMEHRLPWLVFWILMIYMHLFRVIISMVLVKFNKSPIETKEIVKILQKWRRKLRSISSGGLQKEQEVEPEAEHSENISSSKKRRYYYTGSPTDLLAELMSESYTEDDMDPTYVAFEPCFDSTDSTDSPSELEKDIEPQPTTTDLNTTSKSAEVTFESSVCELNADSADSPSELDKDIEPQPTTTDLNTTSKSAEVTFESTVCELNADKTADSLVYSEASEASEAVETAEFPESTSSQNGKMLLNQYCDPTDALIAKLVSLHKNKSVNQ